jgi:AcrR family transcriptional regulator
MAKQGRDVTKPERVDARTVRSLQALNDALLALLVAMPFDSITIREISLRARIGYATFFRHYPTKEALLSDVASAKIAALVGLVRPILAAADSAALTRAVCDRVDEDRRLWAALLTGGAAGIVREEFIEQGRMLQSSGIHTRFDWLPADLVIIYATGAVVDLLAWWLAQGTAMTSAEIAAIMDRLIFAPLGASA